MDREPKKVREERGEMESNGRARETKVKEAEWGISMAVVALAGRVPSGFDSKPIMATGGQHLPVFKSTPSYTQQMFTKQIRTHKHVFS